MADVGNFDWGWEEPSWNTAWFDPSWPAGDTFGAYPDFQLSASDFGYTGQLGDSPFYTSGTGEDLFYDNQTGNYVTFNDIARYDPGIAAELDPDAYGRYVAGVRDAGLTTDTSVNTGGTSGGTGILDNLAKYGPLAAVGGVGLVGLIGTLQKAMQGDQQAITTLERQVAGASPEERQLLSGVLGSVGQLNQLAFGTGGAGGAGGGGAAPASGPAGDIQQRLFAGQLSREQAIHALANMTDNPGGLVDSWLAAGAPGGAGGGGGALRTGGIVGGLESRLPSEEAAFGLGAERAGLATQDLDALMAALGPGVLGAGDLMSGQQSILDPLAGAGAALARGQLNITPELERSVEQAFSPALGDLATQLIEAARNRGFAGGADLLTQAPASALGQTALRDLQGQMAQAKLGLATSLPSTAANIAGAYNTPLAARAQIGSNLVGMNQGVIGTLLNIANQGMSNRMNLFGAMAAPLSATGSALGQAGQNRLAGAGSTQTTTQPQGTLLDAFQPLSSLLSGVGGALGGYAALTRPATTLRLGY